MTTKTFNSAGIVTLDGNTKVKFGNDMIRRIKFNIARGATRIDYIELPEDMNKIDAINFLMTHPDFQSSEDQEVLTEALGSRALRAKRKAKRESRLSLSEIASRERRSENVEATVADILDAVVEVRESQRLMDA